MILFMLSQDLDLYADLPSFKPSVRDEDFSMGGEAFERQRAENAAILAALERKKEARTMAVPTNDAQVRARLREIGHPICLFGEGVSIRM